MTTIATMTIATHIPSNQIPIKHIPTLIVNAVHGSKTYPCTAILFSATLSNLASTPATQMATIRNGQTTKLYTAISWYTIFTSMLLLAQYTTMCSSYKITCLLQMIQDIPQTFDDEEGEFEIDIGVEIRLRADSMEEKDEIKEVVTTL